MVRILRGTAISPGYARGAAFVYDPFRDAELPRYGIDSAQVTAEHKRFHEALDKAVEELQAVERKVFAELGRAEAAIFSAHLAMLKDKSFIERVKARIERDWVNAEHAVDREIAELVRLFSEVGNEYIRQRASDVKDVGRRVLKHLGHWARTGAGTLPPQAVLVAEELLPSDSLDMNRSHLAAFVTERGGGTSHAAILARSLGIPAITGVADATKQIPNGADVLVDGEIGEVIVTPGSNNLARFSKQKTEYDRETAKAQHAESLESVSKDGVKIKLLANVGRLEDVDVVLRHKLGGIGLFRTEYLFLESDQPPDKARQKSVYAEAIRKLPGCPVTIRTLDLGGDKKPRFLARQFEHNPNLGARGLRFSLAEKELFLTQVEAVLESSSLGDVRLLFPMVLGGDDLRQAVREVGLAAHRVGVKKLPLLGAMVETPSALFELEEILNLVDFVSIGTNDLVQFMLAADRSAVDLGGEEMVLYPSVLRAIAEVVAAAQEKNRPVCVCGEAAGNPRIACLLVGLGVRELSMSPDRAARVRVAIRSNLVSELERLARDAVEARAVGAVKRLASEIRIRPD